NTIEKLRDWSNSRSHNNHICLDLLAIVERDCFDFVTALKTIDDVAELKAHAVALVNTPEQRADFRTERGFKRLMRRRDYCHLERTLAQAVRRFHTDKTRADNDGAL